MGQSPSSQFYNNFGYGLPFLQGNRTFGDKYPTFDTWTNSPTKIAEKNDVIMSVRAPVGDLNITPVQMCLGRGVCSIRSLSGNNEFIYYSLKNAMKVISANGSKGTVFDSINRNDLENLEIFLPTNMKEQTNISTILSNIDSLIENNKKFSTALEETAKSLYDYWFTQFDFPDENGRPYRTSGGKMVWNEELKKEIPREWNVCKLKNCIMHIKTGLNPRQNFVLGNGNVKYITVKNLTQSGTIDWTGYDVIDYEAKAKVHARSQISKGDILFASIAPLGRCYLISENPTTWDINESIFSIRPNRNKISSEFLYLLFMGNYFIEKAEHNSTGSVFNGIRINTLENFLLAIPPKELMTQFTQHISCILEEKIKLQQENQTLSSLRDYLLPLLMNGQVTIGD